MTDNLGANGNGPKGWIFQLFLLAVVLTAIYYLTSMGDDVTIQTEDSVNVPVDEAINR